MHVWICMCVTCYFLFFLFFELYIHYGWVIQQKRHQIIFFKQDDNSFSCLLIILFYVYITYSHSLSRYQILKENKNDQTCRPKYHFKKHILIKCAILEKKWTTNTQIWSLQISHHTVVCPHVGFGKTGEKLLFSTNSFMVFSVVLSDVPLLMESGWYTGVISFLNTQQFLLLNPEKHKVSYLEAVFTLKSWK